MKVIEYENTIYRVGQSSKENWDLLDIEYDDEQDSQDNEHGKDIDHIKDKYKDKYKEQDKGQDIEQNKKPNYMWFHLASFSSCYVICCDDNPTKEMIIYGATLCKEYTKYKHQKNIRVNYTPLSNIYKAEKEGAVYMKSNRKVKNVVI